MVISFIFNINDHLPIHVHVWKGGSEAKVILVPEILIQDNYGFKTRELRDVIRIIIDNYEFILEKWHETHG